MNDEHLIEAECALRGLLSEKIKECSKWKRRAIKAEAALVSRAKKRSAEQISGEIVKANFGGSK